MVAALLSAGMSVTAAETLPQGASPLPAAPSNLNAVAVSAEEVSLSWNDNSADERGFIVERSEDGISWDDIGALQANAGVYLDTGLEPDTRYVYRVSSSTGDGEYSASNEDAVVTPPVMDFTLDSGDLQIGAIFLR